jgi:hypothetical protein
LECLVSPKIPWLITDNCFLVTLGQSSSVILLKIELSSKDCLSPNDTPREGNSKPQLWHFTVEGMILLPRKSFKLFQVSLLVFCPLFNFVFMFHKEALFTTITSFTLQFIFYLVRLEDVLIRKDRNVKWN